MTEWYWCYSCEYGCNGPNTETECAGGFYDDIDPEIELECPCCGSTDVAP